jgi:hypothetical protein
MSALLSGLLLLAATPTPTPAPSPAPTVPISMLINRGGQASTYRGQSLSEVAKQIKLNLPADQPRRLDNSDIKRLSAGVELTSSKAEAGPVPAPARNLENSRKYYWQKSYQDATKHAQDAEAAVAALQSDVARLQRDFYSRDDPYQRDGVIKPALDRALADLARAQKELESARGEPDRVMASAQREGALPGWFREPLTDRPLPPPQAGARATVPPPPGATPTRRRPPTVTPVKQDRELSD